MQKFTGDILLDFSGACDSTIHLGDGKESTDENLHIEAILRENGSDGVKLILSSEQSSDHFSLRLFFHKGTLYMRANKL